MISELLKLFKATAARFGFPEWLVNEIVFLLVLLGFVFFVVRQLYKALKWFFLWNNQRRLNHDLHPYYSESDVRRSTKYFIPVKHQNVAPSIDDELGSKYIAARQELIPFFLKEAFRKDKDDNKYYLILADSGMGKTTFLINLYIKYKNQRRFLWSFPKYDIKLFPLSNNKIWEKIDAVKDKKNTILLLDAFDEDLEAIKDYEKRMTKILSKVEDFREIVITCRTQFFPSEKEEPDRTGYFTGGDRGEYRFHKSYLSVFDKKDIKRYLRKRFSIFQLRKRRIAKRITRKSPTLVVRPMLLSHIEDLVKSNRNYRFSFQVYEELIDKWLEREANKPKISKLFNSEENAKKCLLTFSENLAVYLYGNREKHKGYFLPEGEKFDEKLIDILNIPDTEVHFLENIAKGKSLLNRDATGNYKFSHKSVLEYFLAKIFFKNPKLYQNFNFIGMDATKKFFEEMVKERLDNKSNKYKIKAKQFTLMTVREGLVTDENNKTSITGSTSSKDCLYIENFKEIPLSFLDIFPDVDEIALFDRDRLKYLYTLYYKLFVSEEISNWKPNMTKLKEASRHGFHELDLIINRVDYIINSDIAFLQKEFGVGNKNSKKLLSIQEGQKYNQNLNSLLSRFTNDEQLKGEDVLLIQELRTVSEIIKEIEELQKKLPNCKIIY